MVCFTAFSPSIQHIEAIHAYLLKRCPTYALLCLNSFDMAYVRTNYFTTMVSLREYTGVKDAATAILGRSLLELIIFKY